MISPKIIVWNCRGVGSRCAIQHLLLLLRSNNPDILILEETRVQSTYITNFISKTNFDAYLVVEARGFSGGIWVLWDSSKVHLEPISFDDQIMNILVYQRDKVNWLLSAIYASPNPVFRHDLWDYLRCLGPISELTWLLIGDYNQVLSPNEKRGGLPVSTAQVRSFLEVIRTCELLDIGYSRPKFTWSNMRRGMANILERLDRAFCNQKWITTFPNCQVTHLPRS